jgi:hypothetical protein
MTRREGGVNTMGQTYKLKKFKAGSKANYYGAYQLTVPVWMGKMLRQDQEFTVELTDEGILYRPFAPTEATPDTLPEWVERESIPA